VDTSRAMGLELTEAQFKALGPQEQKEYTRLTPGQLKKIMDNLPRRERRKLQAMSRRAKRKGRRL